MSPPPEECEIESKKCVSRISTSSSDHAKKLHTMDKETELVNINVTPQVDEVLMDTY